MKKIVSLFFVFLLFIPSDVLAITSAGEVSEENKTAIYLYNDPGCDKDLDESRYGPIGGVFLRDGINEEVSYSLSDYIESRNVYEDADLAKKACDKFIKSQGNGELLCKDTPERTAYSCQGTIGDVNSNTSTVDTSQYDYLYKYLYGGQMFETETSCLQNCRGKCSLKTGNTFRYVPTINEEAQGSIESITGRIFQTDDGSFAFCLQPAKEFYCPYYYSLEDLIPQYCLNNTFDLSVCSEDYDSDYRCGLAYIAFVGTEASGTYTKDQYGATDMAMRMWASNKGHLSGTKATDYPLQGGKTTDVNFYGITAQRVEEDANYLEYGVPCSKTARNHGVVCNNDYDTYMKALKLYHQATEIEKFDAGGNKVPVLVTSTLIDNGNIVQLTNPTKESCEKGSENCRTVISLFNSSGQKIDSNSNYCDKNYCYAEYSNENLCDTTATEAADIEVLIKDFSVSGSYNEYHHCDDPTGKQIMFTIDGSATVETKKDYLKEYKVNVTCGCSSTGLRTTSDAEDYPDGIKTCNNKDIFNTKESDYDGYETGIIKDPPMKDILDQRTCEKERNYFRAEEYETAEDTCKIYCRKEIDFYLANKEKVYSGMQFRYELEEKITNNLDSGEHLTSIVLQKTQCVSEIYFDTPNPDIDDPDKDTWLERFDAAERLVEETWNEWKKWDVLRYKQEQDRDYPEETSIVHPCSINCDGYETLGSSAEDVCTAADAAISAAQGIPGQGLGSGAGHISKSYCDDYNSALQSVGNKTGVCTPECASDFTWSARNYWTIDYETGKQGNPSSSYKSGDASAGGSTYTCSLSFSFVVGGIKTITPCSRTNCERYVDEAQSFNTGPINSASSFNDFKNDALNKIYQAISADFVSISRISNINMTTNNGGDCTSGNQGDDKIVINNAIKAREKYYAAQEAVQNLLTDLQKCSMYGSELDEEPSIISYTLTKEPPGPPGGSGDGSSDGVGSGSSGGGGINKSSSEIKEYKANTLEVIEGEKEFNLVEAASTENEISIKRIILSNASCKDDKCVNLDLSYADGSGNYGKTSQYSKVTGIIETDDLFNAYCDDGEDCYRRVHTESEVDEEDVWERTHDTPKKQRMIICDVTSKDAVNHKCTVEEEDVPDNDYVSFKVTTEVDFYRNKNYYSKAFTGEVIESKSAATFKSKQYSSLGNNVYPVSKDVETGTHDVNYIFSNLGISRFGEKELSTNLTTYKYDCSYEVYNNSTGYDCIVQYNEDGTPKVDECSNFCFFVNESVPDLRCIKWNASNDDSGYGFVYRNVDLENLFPSGRPYGNNWSNATEIISEIQDTGTDLYATTDHLVLSVTLNSDSIKKIREYNRFKNTNAGGYLDNSLADCSLEVSLDGYNNRFSNCKSTFIDELENGSGVLGVQTNFINRIGSDKE